MSADCTILDLKKIVQKSEGYLSTHLQLHFEDSVLDNAKRLRDYGITGNCSLRATCIFRPVPEDHDIYYCGFLASSTPSDREEEVSRNTVIRVRFRKNPNNRMLNLDSFEDVSKGGTCVQDMVSELGAVQAGSRGFVQWTEEQTERCVHLLELLPDVESRLQALRYHWRPFGGVNGSYQGGDRHSWQRYTRRLPVPTALTLDKENQTLTLKPLTPLAPNTLYGILLMHGVGILETGTGDTHALFSAHGLLEDTLITFRTTASVELPEESLTSIPMTPTAGGAVGVDGRAPVSLSQSLSSGPETELPPASSKPSAGLTSSSNHVVSVTQNKTVITAGGAPRKTAVASDGRPKSRVKPPPTVEESGHESVPSTSISHSHSHSRESKDYNTIVGKPSESPSSAPTVSIPKKSKVLPPPPPSPETALPDAASPLPTVAAGRALSTLGGGVTDTDRAASKAQSRADSASVSVAPVKKSKRAPPPLPDALAAPLQDTTLEASKSSDIDELLALSLPSSATSAKPLPAKSRLSFPAASTTVENPKASSEIPLSRQRRATTESTSGLPSSSAASFSEYKKSTEESPSLQQSKNHHGSSHSAPRPESLPNPRLLALQRAERSVRPRDQITATAPQPDHQSTTTAVDATVVNEEQLSEDRWQSEELEEDENKKECNIS